MKEEDLILIDKYLDDTMDEAEKEAFESRLSSDIQLATRLKTVQEIAVANTLQTKAFRTVVEEVGQNIGSTVKPSKKTFTLGYRRLAMAASFLALVASGFLLWFVLSSPADNATLFAEQFTPYPNNITMRNDQANSPLLNAMALYDAQNYPGAIKIFESIVDNAKSDTVLFYEGLSHLSNDEPEIAIKKLANVINNSKSNYRIQAEWYSALAYLKNDDQVNTISLLTNLSNQTVSNVYAQKAKKLLMELD